MTTRQYIGARYVPIFADPIQWSDEREYEPLMMVQSSGETYITKQATPIGVQLPDITQGEEDNAYWVHMSDWNAQVEQYRQEVLQYNSRIATLENDLPSSSFDSVNTVAKAISDVSDIIPSSSFDSVNTVAKAISDVSNIIPASSFDSNNTVKDYIDDEVNAVKSIIPASSFNSVNTVKKYIDDEVNEINNDIADVKTKQERSSGVYKNVLVIGDSFSSKTYFPSTNTWWELLDDFGLSCTCYASSGASFAGNMSGQNKIIDLVNTAIAAIQDPTSIDRVIVYAGYNDIFNYTQTTTDIALAMAVCFNTLANNFDCPIDFYINNAQYDQAYSTEHMARLVEVVNKCAMQSLCRPKVDSVFWFAADMLASTVESNGIHPNADGQKLIAANMMSNGDCFINSHNYGFNNTYASGTFGKGTVSAPSVGSIIPSTRNGVYDITLKDIGVSIALTSNIAAGTLNTVQYSRVPGLYYPFKEIPLSADGFDSANGVYISNAYIRNNTLFVEFFANSAVSSGTTIDLKLNAQGTVNLAKHMRQSLS